MKRVAILGSTGSIGVQALDVVARFPDRFQVVGLAAGRNAARLAEQVQRFRPRVVSVADEGAARELRELGAARHRGARRRRGRGRGRVAPRGRLRARRDLGRRGPPLHRGGDRGRQAGGPREQGVARPRRRAPHRARGRDGRADPAGRLEHSAIHQSLVGHNRAEVRRLILTASGGPLRTVPAEEPRDVAPARALKHPNWSMGDKITIDSATLMNKGLEVIEARWLFGVEPRRIDIVVHPESIVHSMVEYIDGSMVAQLGVSDMRGPISYAMGHPERLPLDLAPLDLARLGKLTFEQPDAARFPAFMLAYRARARRHRAGRPVRRGRGGGGGVPRRRCRFTDIAEICAAVLEAHALEPVGVRRAGARGERVGTPRGRAPGRPFGISPGSVPRRQAPSTREPERNARTPGYHWPCRTSSSRLARSSSCSAGSSSCTSSGTSSWRRPSG